MNKLYLKLLILPCVIIITLFASCDKVYKQTQLIQGGYTLEYASIDGEDVTDFLLNDTVNLTSLLIAKNEEVGSPFFFYFNPIDDYYAYSSAFSFEDENTVKIYNHRWGLYIPSFLDDNIAFFPFTKQEIIILKIETLSENQFVFSTIYSGKKYKYDFKD